MKDKIFIKSYDEVQEIITKPMGYGLVSDRITVDGLQIGYMYREEPDNKQDSGWRFFAGDESEEYLDNEMNIELMNVNTIAHYDRSVIPYLEAPHNSAFGKDEHGEFIEEDFESED